MGQYYLPIIRRTTAKNITRNESIYAHDFKNALKLTEHSWVGNNFVNIVCNDIIDKPARIIWLGDYTETYDAPEGFPSAKYKTLMNCWSRGKSTKRFITKGNQEFDWNKQWFLVNSSKECYIDMRKYIDYATTADGWCIHPLPLLTCSSNGKGRGDYYGCDRSAVGSWCNDIIYLTVQRPIEYFEEEYFFRED